MANSESAARVALSSRTLIDSLPIATSIPEGSTSAAEKAPDQNIPQVHALLAQIFLQKQDYPHAAAEMRTYLQVAPQGQFAEQIKKDLEQIKSVEANAAQETSATAEPPAPAEEPTPGEQPGMGH